MKSIFYTYLTPLIPLSFEGEGEVLKRGAMPLFIKTLSLLGEGE
jgi:hypothetical protein